MASATVTSLDGVLKVFYDDFKVKTLQYGESTVLGMLPRMTKFGGKNLPIPIVYNTPQGRGVTVSQAQTVASPSKNTDFVLTRVSDYGVVTISNEALEASEMGDKAAFVSARVTEIDGIMTQLVRSLSTALFGTGSGSIGNVGSISTVDLTLSDIEQVVNFDVGMEITGSSADASGARVGSATITAINYDTGVLTTDANWTTQITSLTAGDFLQCQGDLANKLTGFGGWIPSSAPGATAFFGVDRSVNPSRLGGIRVPASVVPASLAIEEKVLRSVARVGREGSKPDLFVCNHAKFADLQASLGSRVVYGEVKSHDGDFGFRSIQITSGTNTVDIVADPYCPSNVGYILQKDTWKLYSLGDVPRFENSDGLMMLRQATSDGVEVRCKYYAQLGCVAPGKNGRVAL
jgi:hypothetical protein